MTPDPPALRAALLQPGWLNPRDTLTPRPAPRPGCSPGHRGRRGLGVLRAGARNAATQRHGSDPAMHQHRSAPPQLPQPGFSAEHPPESQPCMGGGRAPRAQHPQHPRSGLPSAPVALPWAGGDQHPHPCSSHPSHPTYLGWKRCQRGAGAAAVPSGWPSRPGLARAASGERCPRCRRAQSLCVIY